LSSSLPPMGTKMGTTTSTSLHRHEDVHPSRRTGSTAECSLTPNSSLKLVVKPARDREALCVGGRMQRIRDREGVGRRNEEGGGRVPPPSAQPCAAREWGERDNWHVGPA
jgi:hypothetical protein